MYNQRKQGKLSMHVNSRIWCALFLSLPFLSFLPAAAAVPDSENILMLSQNTGDFGTIDVYAGKSAIRCTVRRTQGSIQARAPDWKVVAFNAKQKTFWHTDLQSWRKNGLTANGDGVRPAFIGKVVHPRSTTICGQAAHMFIVHTNVPAPEGFFSNPRARPLRVVSVVLYALDCPQFDPKVLQFLQSFYKDPELGGLPVAVLYHFDDQTKVWNMQTSAIRRMKVSPSFFDYPSNLHSVRTPELVLGGKELETMINGLLNIQDEKTP